MKASFCASHHLRGAQISCLAAPLCTRKGELGLRVRLCGRGTLHSGPGTAQGNSLCLGGEVPGMAAGDSVAGAHRHKKETASGEGNPPSSLSTVSPVPSSLHPSLGQEGDTLELRKVFTDAEVPLASGVTEQAQSTQLAPQRGVQALEAYDLQKCQNDNDGVQARSEAATGGGGLSSSNLPPRFLNFLHLNGIDPSLYIAAASVPRHIRIRPLDALLQGKTQNQTSSQTQIQSQTQFLTQEGAGQEDQRQQEEKDQQASCQEGHVKLHQVKQQAFLQQHQTGHQDAEEAEAQRSAGSFAVRSSLVPSPAEVAAVEEDLGVTLEPLPWLPGFFSLPPDHPIAGTRSYKTGRIFGMDAASGAAVAALGIQEGDHVLDLCAAPGAKLAMMADSLGQGSGTLTAVDVSLPRLAATKTVLVKYKVADQCRLFLGDATCFALPPPLPNLSALRRGNRNRDVITPQPSSPDGQGHSTDDDGCQERDQGKGDVVKDSLGGPTGEARGLASEDLGMLATEYGTCLTVNGRQAYEEGLSGHRTSNAGPSMAATPFASPAAATEASPDASLSDGASSEPSQRRKKTRNERRRARKLRQFTAYLPEASPSTSSTPSAIGALAEGSVQDGTSHEAERQHGDEAELRQVQHPELYFVGRKAWQWWDPSRDALAEPKSHFERPPENGVTGALRPPRLYDKVLVDAECTHDGSVKHVLKFEDWGWETLDRRFMDQGRLSHLGQLQRRLLGRGFALLKPGGLLVYCTCSLTKAQNEDVVESFLALHADAWVVPVPGASAWPCKAGGVPHTLRFDPITSHTGGLFIALVTKK